MPIWAMVFIAILAGLLIMRMGLAMWDMSRARRTRHEDYYIGMKLDFPGGLTRTITAYDPLTRTITFDEKLPTVHGSQDTAE